MSCSRSGRRSSSISPLWLKHFRFGPVEWLWRTPDLYEAPADAARRATEHEGRCALALLALARLRDAEPAPPTGSGGSIPMSAVRPRRQRGRDDPRLSGEPHPRSRSPRCAAAAATPPMSPRARPRARRCDPARRRPAAAQCGARGVRGARPTTPAARRLDGRIDPAAAARSDLSVAVPDTPWHLYDFDLASLTIAAQYRPDRRAGLQLRPAAGLARRRPDDFLRYLGRADLRFVREERHGGRRALRFEAGGPGLRDARRADLVRRRRAGTSSRRAGASPTTRISRLPAPADRCQRRRRAGLAKAADEPFRRLPGRAIKRGARHLGER